MFYKLFCLINALFCFLKKINIFKILNNISNFWLCQIEIEVNRGKDSDVRDGGLKFLAIYLITTPVYCTWFIHALKKQGLQQNVIVEMLSKDK